jgi:hypothetical protein
VFRTAGDLAGALACYAEFPEIARIEQDPQFHMAYLRNTSEILILEQRRYREGHDVVRQGVDLSLKLNEWWNRAELTGLLGLTTAALGDLDRGIALIEAVGDRSGSDIYAAAFLVHCRARIHELAGRVADAELAYRKAGEIIDATGFRRGQFSALTRIDHARFLHANGRGDEALVRLAEAEAMLGPQTGERAELLRALRERMTAVASRPAD